MVHSVEELGSRAAPPAQRRSVWVVRAEGGLSSSQTLSCRVPTAFWNPAPSQEGAECQSLREFPPSHLPAGARARLHGISAGCGHQGPLPKARPGFLRPGACCLVAAFVSRCLFPVLTVSGLSAFTVRWDPQGGPTEEIVPPPLLPPRRPTCLLERPLWFWRLSVSVWR